MLRSCGVWWWLSRLDCFFGSFTSNFVASTGSPTLVSAFGVVRWCLTFEFSVSARHHQTRVLPCARGLVLLLLQQRRAVCSTNLKITCIEGSELTTLCHMTNTSWKWRALLPHHCDIASTFFTPPPPTSVEYRPRLRSKLQHARVSSRFYHTT